MQVVEAVKINPYIAIKMKASDDLNLALKAYEENLRLKQHSLARENELRVPILSALEQFQESDRFEVPLYTLAEISRFDYKLNSYSANFRSELSLIIASRLEQELPKVNHGLLEDFFMDFKKELPAARDAFFNNSWFDVAYRKTVQSLDSLDVEEMAEACCDLLKVWSPNVQQNYKNQFADKTIRSLIDLEKEKPGVALHLAEKLRDTLKDSGDHTIKNQLYDFIENIKTYLGQLPNLDKSLTARVPLDIVIPLAPSAIKAMKDSGNIDKSGFLTNEFSSTVQHGSFFYYIQNTNNYVSQIEVAVSGARSIRMTGEVDPMIVAALKEEHGSKPFMQPSAIPDNRAYNQKI